MRSIIWFWRFQVDRNDYPVRHENSGAKDSWETWETNRNLAMNIIIAFRYHEAFETIQNGQSDQKSIILPFEFCFAANSKHTYHRNYALNAKNILKRNVVQVLWFDVRSVAMITSFRDF